MEPQMEPYTLLSNNIEELGKIFNAQMNDYDKRLSESSSSPTRNALNLSSLSREFVDFRSFISKSLGMLKAQTDILFVNIDRHENASRRKVLLFHGVPETALVHVSNQVTFIIRQRMRLQQVADNNIVACYRIGNLREKPRPILVRFNNYAARSEVWNNKAVLKGYGITCTEFLTRRRHEVFIFARKHFGIHYCFTVDGKVVILLPDGTRAKIEGMDELRELIKKYPRGNADRNQILQNNIDNY